MSYQTQSPVFLCSVVYLLFWVIYHLFTFQSAGRSPVLQSMISSKQSTTVSPPAFRTCAGVWSRPTALLLLFVRLQYVFHRSLVSPLGITHSNSHHWYQVLVSSPSSQQGLSPVGIPSCCYLFCLILALVHAIFTP